MATKTEKNVQLKINKMTKNIFDQLSVQGLISEDELYLLSDDETGSATWGTIGGELSNQTDLKIMLDSKADKSELDSKADKSELDSKADKSELDSKVDKSIVPTILSAYALSSDVDARLSQKADKSEIPTVNNPTITFTQGNSVKGSITLNQANDQTISLDAGGGGGGGIPADLSCNHLSVGTSVSLGTGCTASGEYGSIAQGALSKATANAAVALGSQCIASQQMSYAIGYKAEARHSYSMVLALTNNDNYESQSNDYNSLNIYVGNGEPTFDALNSILVNGLTLQNHIDQIIESKPAQQQFYFYPYDIGSNTQQGSNIQIGTSYSNFDKGIICFEVEFVGGTPLNIAYTDPWTYNQQNLEYYLSPADYSGNTVGAIVTVPCTFGPGVNVYNNYGTNMNVRELYRIEFNNVFG